MSNTDSWNSPRLNCGVRNVPGTNIDTSMETPPRDSMAFSAALRAAISGIPPAIIAPAMLLTIALYMAVWMAVAIGLVMASPK